MRLPQTCDLPLVGTVVLPEEGTPSPLFNALLVELAVTLGLELSAARRPGSTPGQGTKSQSSTADEEGKPPEVGLTG